MDDDDFDASMNSNRELPFQEELSHWQDEDYDYRQPSGNSQSLAHFHNDHWGDDEHGYEGRDSYDCTFNKIGTVEPIPPSQRTEELKVISKFSPVEAPSKPSFGQSMPRSEEENVVVSKPREAANPTSTASKRNGPFPFLKKGSRKEPSALNRIDSPKKITLTPDDPAPGRGFTNETIHIEVKQPQAPPTNTTSVRTPAAKKLSYSSNNTDRKAPNPTVKVPPEPKINQSYWGLDTTIMEDMEEFNRMKNNPQNQNNNALKANKTHPQHDFQDNSYLDDTTWDGSNRILTEARPNQYRDHDEDDEEENEAYDRDDCMEAQSEASIEYQKYLEAATASNHPSHRIPSQRLSESQPQPRPTTSITPNGWGHVTQPKPYAPSTIEEMENHLEDHQDYYEEEEDIGRSHSSHHHPPRVKLARSTSQKLQQLRSSTPNHRITNQQSNNSVRSESQGEGSDRAIRPTSTLKPTESSQRNKSNNNARKSTPSQNKSTNNNSNNNARSGSTAIPSFSELEQKMMELQQEVEIYRTKTQKLHKLEKQKEFELSEVLAKKDEILKKCDEEKLATKKWCEDQKLAIERERKLAAKQARDRKALTGEVPIRKEKAEIEGLKATIEKMKVNYDTAQQKWKLENNRLHDLVKDYSAHIENLEKQLVIVEEQKIQLLEFINEQGLRLPKNLRQSLSQSDQQQQQTKGLPLKQKELLASKQRTLQLQKQASKIAGNRGHAEEVDIEVYEGSTGPTASSYHYKIVAEDLAVETSRTPNGAASKTKTMNIPEEGLAPGEVFTRLSGSGNMFRNSNTTTHQRNGKMTTATTKGHPPIPPHTTTTTNSLNHSWSMMRSSKSSARYSSSLEAEEEDYDEDNHYYGNEERDARQSQSDVIEEEEEVEEVEVEHDPYHRSQTNFSNGALMTEADLLDRLLDRHHQQERLTSRVSSTTSATTITATTTSASAATLDYNPKSTFATTATTATNNSLPSTGSAVTSSLKAKTMPLSITKEEEITNNPPPASSSSQPIGRSEEVLDDGTRLIRYRNGTIKEVNPHNGHTLVKFVNGDTKFTDPQSGKVIYFYAQANTTHTTFPNGLELYQFPNGQTEKHFPDGKKEVIFPDKIKKVIYPDGIQESIFPDGVILKEYTDGTKEVLST